MFMGIALLYRQTMAHSVAEIDCGELAAVQALLGIAHPTGYPVFTMLGHIFLQLPLGGSAVYRLNLLSLLLCIAALGVLHRVFLNLARSEQDNPRDSWIIAGGATLFVALNRTFWAQSGIVEVHALQLLLLSGILLLSLRLSRSSLSDVRLWLLLGVNVALGFSNHMTTGVVVPGLIYLFARIHRSERGWFRRLSGMAVLVCVVVISTYVFLPIRAAQEPLVNWGNPSTWERLWRHVSGQQYRVWLFSSFGSAVRNSASFARGFPGQFGYIGFAVGLCGMAASLRRRGTQHVFLFVTFLCSVLYAINYDIHDLEAYFLPGYLVFGIWIAGGLSALVTFARGRMVGMVAIAGMILLGTGLCIVTGFRWNDRSDLFVYEDYTKSVLGSLPQGAILISYQWDFLVSPSYYYQHVEQYRDDVAVVDKELLRRSWYFDHLRVLYPEVVQEIEPEVQRFVEAVIPFECNQRYDPTLLERRYRSVITRLIETGVETREVFLGPELVDGELRRGELSLPRGLSIVPHMLTFQVVPPRTYAPYGGDLPNIRFPTPGDHYSDAVRSLVLQMLVNRATYEAYHQREDEARAVVNHIRRVFPVFQLPNQLQAF
jgi:hypothetical protein